MQLPCLNYLDWQQRPAVFAQHLILALRQHGFVLLRQHPLTAALREQAFACASAFFAQSSQQKNRINIAKSPNHRGYFDFTQEKLDVRNYPQGDNKEGLKIGRDLGCDHPYVKTGIALHGPNQWPAFPPDFQSVMNALFAKLTHISCSIMDAIGNGFGLPDNYFAPLVNEPMATLAPLHYLPRSSEADIGAGAHTDFGCITLVIQNGTPGLQLWNTEHSQWIDIPSDPDLLVVNIGDMLERWSNKQLSSTRHRVCNTDERYSFAFFFDPNYNAQIAPLPGTVDDNHPARFPPISALEYLQQRISRSFDYFGAQQGTHH